MQFTAYEVWMAPLFISNEFEVTLIFLAVYWQFYDYKY